MYNDAFATTVVISFYYEVSVFSINLITFKIVLQSVCQWMYPQYIGYLMRKIFIRWDALLHFHYFDGMHQEFSTMRLV